MIDLRSLAKALDGEVVNGQLIAPGPNRVSGQEAASSLLLMFHHRFCAEMRG
jgi:hypothetical protein